eukprot:PhF_6_TR5599/c0_g1_i1/m.8051
MYYNPYPPLPLVGQCGTESLRLRTNQQTTPISCILVSSGSSSSSFTPSPSMSQVLDNTCRIMLVTLILYVAVLELTWAVWYLMPDPDQIGIVLSISIIWCAVAGFAFWLWGNEWGEENLLGEDHNVAYKVVQITISLSFIVFPMLLVSNDYQLSYLYPLSDEQSHLFLHSWHDPSPDLSQYHTVSFLETTWRINPKKQRVHTINGVDDDDKHMRYNYCVAPIEYFGKAPGVTVNLWAVCYQASKYSPMAACDDTVIETDCGWHLPSRLVSMRVLHDEIPNKDVDPAELRAYHHAIDLAKHEPEQQVATVVVYDDGTPAEYTVAVEDYESFRWRMNVLGGFIVCGSWALYYAWIAFGKITEMIGNVKRYVFSKFFKSNVKVKEKY